MTSDPETDPPAGALPRRLALALVAGTLLLYAVCAGFGYTGWDDEAYITVNPMMESGSSLVAMWTTDRLEQYYPLTFTLYWLEYRLWGRDPAGYHVVNVLVHALNVFLVLLLLRRLAASVWVSGFTAAIFAAHPLQAMSVAWIAERKNLLSCAFGLLTLLAWRRFRAGGGRAWYGAALAAFAAALMSKTAILGLPLLLLLIDVAFFRRDWRRSVGPLVPFVLLGAAFALVTIHFEQKFLGTMPPPSLRPLIAAAGVWFYLGKMLVPAGLLPIYPLWGVSLGDPRWWIPLAALLVAAAALWRWRRRFDRWTVFGLLFFFLFLGPTSGLFAFGNLTVTYASDHYVYLPLIGVAVALLVPLERWSRRRRERGALVTGALGLLVLLHAVLTLRYLPAFDDARSMWTRTLEGNPEAFPAHMGLGVLEKQQGEWPRAIGHFRRAARALPEEVDARYELADCLLRSGAVEEARREFAGIVSDRPGESRAHYNLGVIAEAAGRLEEARAAYDAGLACAPDDAARAFGHVARGRLALGLLRREEAAEAFAEAVRLAPQDALARVGLATAQRGLGRTADAIATLEAALDAGPGDVDAVGAMVLLARILATSPEPEHRDGPRAVALAERARGLAPPHSLPVVEALAAAWAEVGRFDEAADLLEREAARFVAGAAPPELARQAAAYRRREPLREESPAGR